MHGEDQKKPRKFQWALLVAAIVILLALYFAER
jgi:hypothetical protein